MDVLIFDGKARLAAYPAIPGLVVTADPEALEASAPMADRLVAIGMLYLKNDRLERVLRTIRPEVSLYLLVDDVAAPGPRFNARCNEAGALVREYCLGRQFFTTGWSTFPERLSRILAGPPVSDRQAVKSGEGGPQHCFGRDLPLLGTKFAGA